MWLPCWRLSHVLCLLMGFGLTAVAQRTDLQGAWQFRESGGKDWLPAQVPGTVHTDLLAAKLIPDPFVGNQATQVQWIEQLDWEYTKTFRVTDNTLQQGQVDLVFEGLDTYADVELNGQLLGRTDNMHRRWRFSCKPYLKLGDNVLLVRFRSPMQAALPAYQASPYPLPAGNDAGDKRLSPYVRKAAYNFGWDFAPRLLTAGMWRPVYLEAWSGVRIAHLHGVPLQMNAHEAPVRAIVELDIAEPGEYEIDILLDGELVVSTTRDMVRGSRTVAMQFTIHEPEFWWPRGMGEAKSYHLGARVKRAQNTICFHSQTLGLRSIKLVMAPDSIGTGFYFSVNDFLPDRGGPLFIKGANYVPEDVFLPRGRARMLQNLEAADAVGMNMLRVWGGGVYADDAFYDWCDAHGILVWQDLPFACMMYPLEGQFLENVKAELEDNVRRLRYHPSLAIWCGNNEIDVAWHNWGWQQEGGYSEAFAGQLWQQYQSFFEMQVPNTLNALDPDRAYIPSSPLSNWGKAENFKHKNMHYWGVWHGTDSLDGFERYIPRFMSEYGFQSWPSPASLKPYIAAQDWNLQSTPILHRQKSYKGNAPILRFLRPSYGEPKDFDAFLQLSQYVQRDAMAIAIEAQRMQQPHCMGTLYWQLNDCWPGPSWSTLEYNGTWKPAHYALRRLYGPVLLSATIAHDSLQVQIASELPPTHCNLTLRLKSFDGNVFAGSEATFTVRPGGRSYLHIPMAALSGQIDPARHFLEVTLYQGRAEIATDLVYFAPPRALELIDPAYSFQVTAASDGYLLTMTSKTLVKDLEIHLDGAEATFSDNYFDLVPGRSRSILIQADPEHGPAAITRMLRFTELSALIQPSAD